jgi:hypothetical protein
MLTVLTNAVTNSPPTITVQPQSITNGVGDNIRFAVTATSLASSPAYQWRFNGTLDVSQTSSAYVWNSIDTTNAGSYQVVITNIAGKVTSDVATLTVTNASPPPNTNAGASITAGTVRAGTIIIGR